MPQPAAPTGQRQPRPGLPQNSDHQRELAQQLQEHGLQGILSHTFRQSRQHQPGRIRHDENDDDASAIGRRGHRYRPGRGERDRGSTYEATSAMTATDRGSDTQKESHDSPTRYGTVRRPENVYRGGGPERDRRPF